MLRINYREVRTELGRLARRLLHARGNRGNGRVYHSGGDKIWSDLGKSLIVKKLIST